MYTYNTCNTARDGHVYELQLVYVHRLHAALAAWSACQCNGTVLSYTGDMIWKASGKLSCVRFNAYRGGTGKLHLCT